MAEKKRDFEKELNECIAEKEKLIKDYSKKEQELAKLEEKLKTEKELIEKAKAEVKEKIDVVKMRKETNELKDMMLRDRAELENFKRRTNDERIKDRKYAQFYILQKLVDMKDNIEKALNAEVDMTNFKKGIELIDQQLTQLLKDENVEEIEANNVKFDPNYHQAVLTETNDKLDDDLVTEVLAKGYMYKDRILRPSMVKVNKKEN